MPFTLHTLGQKGTGPGTLHQFHSRVPGPPCSRRSHAARCGTSRARWAERDQRGSSRRTSGAARLSTSPWARVALCSAAGCSRSSMGRTTFPPPGGPRRNLAFFLVVLSGLRSASSPCSPKHHGRLTTELHGRTACEWAAWPPPGADALYCFCAPSRPSSSSPSPSSPASSSSSRSPGGSSVAAIPGSGEACDFDLEDGAPDLLRQPVCVWA